MLFFDDKIPGDLLLSFAHDILNCIHFLLHITCQKFPVLKNTWEKKIYSCLMPCLQGSSIGADSDRGTGYLVSLENKDGSIEGNCFSMDVLHLSPCTVTYTVILLSKINLSWHVNKI